VIGTDFKKKRINNYDDCLTESFFDLTPFAGLLLPKEPLNLLPFAVFLSPLPIVIFFE
jgi:hypothetical protein